MCLAECARPRPQQPP